MTDVRLLLFMCWLETVKELDYSLHLQLVENETFGYFFEAAPFKVLKVDSQTFSRNGKPL